MRNNAAFTPLEKELMRRGNAGRKLVRQGRLEGWKALWWVTAPEREAREQAAAMGMELQRGDRSDG